MTSLVLIIQLLFEMTVSISTIGILRNKVYTKLQRVVSWGLKYKLNKADNSIADFLAIWFHHFQPNNKKINDLFTYKIILVKLDDWNLNLNKRKNY